MVARSFVGAAVMLGVFSSSAVAARIFMPQGSTVWMKFQTAAAPIADGNDAAGSNRPGTAPPNGIPLTTVADTQGRSATGFAEVFPDRVRTYIRSQTASAFMYASFQDTYTVGGTAVGAFDIPVQLRVEGTMRTVLFGPNQVPFLSAANVQAKIGTFNPSFDGQTPLNEGFRVTQFNSAAFAFFEQPTTTVASAIPVDLTATYTKVGLRVGDTFTIAYGVNAAFSIGEIDLRNTGTIGFTLPPGVTLTSALTSSVPEPTLAVQALATLAVVLIRKPRRSNSVRRD